jgi:hypothetical protein
LRPRAGFDRFGKPNPHRDSIPGPSDPWRDAIPTEVSCPADQLLLINSKVVIIINTAQHRFSDKQLEEALVK